MKFTRKVIIFSILCITAGLIFSCSMDIQEPMPTALQPVENLKVELVGDTAQLSWDNPLHDGLLSAVIKHNFDTETVEDATSFKYGLIEVNTIYRFVVRVKDSEGNLSIGRTVELFREGPDPVQELTGFQEGNSIIINWKLPETDIASVRLIIDGSEEIILPADATSYVLDQFEFREYNFQLNTIDSNDKTSTARFVKVTGGPTKIAYLGVAADVALITDDDEIASSTWFFQNYPDGEYLSFNAIKAGKDLSQYRVLWWHYDNQEGNPAPPAIAVDAAVKTAITEFHKNGGALLLNTHAVQYLYTMGRFTANFDRVIGAGQGFHHDHATWGVNVNIGRTFDKSSHPLYEGLEITDVDGRKVIPFLGPGWREDHNYTFIHLPAFYGYANHDPAAYTAISERNNVNILGQWESIPDFWMMGFFETRPTDGFKGTAIALGIGAFEWNKNDGDNPYQGNIERITKNALDYLRTQ